MPFMAGAALGGVLVGREVGREPGDTRERRVGVLPERGHPVRPVGQADTASSSPVFCVCDSAGLRLLQSCREGGYTPEQGWGWGEGGGTGPVSHAQAQLGGCCPFVGVLKGQEGSHP